MTRTAPRAAKCSVCLIGLAVALLVVLLQPSLANAETRIQAVHGSGFVSPFADKDVKDVVGVVTAVCKSGFWFQDPDANAKSMISSGLHVYTKTPPAVQVGDKVSVSGRVTQFRPNQQPASLSVTEISEPAVKKLSSKNAVPKPVSIAAYANGVPSSPHNGKPSDVETSPTLDVRGSAVDFFESLEGMLVEVPGAVAIGPTTKFGDIPILVDPKKAAGRTAAGGVFVTSKSFNPGRLLVSPTIVGKPPAANTGDGVGTVVGVLHYSFGMFRILNTAPLAVSKHNLQPQVAPTPSDTQLAVATFNVENFGAADTHHVQEIAHEVVTALRSPDLIGVQEIEGSKDDSDGTTSGAPTLEALVRAISAEGGPAYEFVEIAPKKGQDGGKPGANIHQAFLYKTNRGLEFASGTHGTSEQKVAVAGTRSALHLSLNPGRIDPANAAFEHSRKPLAVEFKWRGKQLFVINNHLASKVADQPFFGRFQPALEPSAAKREQQAKVVGDFVQQILRANRDANIVVLGDFNDYDFSPAVGALKNSSLADLVDQVPQNQRYSYVYEGNSQTLDHIFVSANLKRGAQYSPIHINSDFASSSSDHDPGVALISVPGARASRRSSAAR